MIDHCKGNFVIRMRKTALAATTYHLWRARNDVDFGACTRIKPNMIVGVVILDVCAAVHSWRDIPCGKVNRNVTMEWGLNHVIFERR